MPRSKDGIKRIPVDTEALTKAVHAVTASPSKRISFREACKVYKVKLSTLARHVKSHKNIGVDQFRYVSNIDAKRVFTNEEEVSLVKYIEKIAQMRYGMSKLKVRQLAFKFAKANNKTYPKEWDSEGVAGESWMRHFMKRQKLSVRKAEAISKGRACSFNIVNVNKFYDNLENVHKRFGPFPASKIYNLDETGVTTVQNPGKVVVPTNTKDVASTTSAERGQLVTMIGCVSASGNHIPPMLIFPRVNFKEYMMTGAPPGSIGAANRSGWSTETTFLQFIDHFISHVKPSREDRVLLVMDNHETHLSVEAIEKASNHGIVIVTFPPHTSHKLQPLDVSVYKPFKTHYNQAIDSWLANNPGKSFTIYNVAEMVGYAFAKAFSTSNICSGFKATGISPLDRNVWSEADFLGSYSTDRPAPVMVEEPTTSHVVPNTSPAELTISPATPTPSPATPTPSPATPRTSQAASQIEVEVEIHSTGEFQEKNMQGPLSSMLLSTKSTAIKSNNIGEICKTKTPEQVQPFPKAGERKTKVSRRQGKTRIVTDTPEINEIRKQKEKKICIKPTKAAKKTGGKEPPKVVRTLFDKINEIKKEIVCSKCHLNFSKHDKVIVCIECKKKCHRQCIPKKYEFLDDEDDSGDFVCPDCKSKFNGYSDLGEDDDNDDNMYSLNDLIVGLANK